MGQEEEVGEAGWWLEGGCDAGGGGIVATREEEVGGEEALRPEAVERSTCIGSPGQGPDGPAEGAGGPGGVACEEVEASGEGEPEGDDLRIGWCARVGGAGEFQAAYRCGVAADGSIVSEQTDVLLGITAVGPGGTRGLARRGYGGAGELGHEEVLGRGGRRRPAPGPGGRAGAAESGKRGEAEGRPERLVAGSADRLLEQGAEGIRGLEVARPGEEEEGEREGVGVVPAESFEGGRAAGRSGRDDLDDGGPHAARLREAPVGELPSQVESSCGEGGFRELVVKGDVGGVLGLETEERGQGRIRWQAEAAAEPPQRERQGSPGLGIIRVGGRDGIHESHGSHGVSAGGEVDGAEEGESGVAANTGGADCAGGDVVSGARVVCHAGGEGGADVCGAECGIDAGGVLKGDAGREEETAGKEVAAVEEVAGGGGRPRRRQGPTRGVDPDGLAVGDRAGEGEAEACEGIGLRLAPIGGLEEDPGRRRDVPRLHHERRARTGWRDFARDDVPEPTLLRRAQHRLHPLPAPPRGRRGEIRRLHGADAWKRGGRAQERAMRSGGVGGDVLAPEGDDDDGRHDVIVGAGPQGQGEDGGPEEQGSRDGGTATAWARAGYRASRQRRPLEVRGRGLGDQPLQDPGTLPAGRLGSGPGASGCDGAGLVTGPEQLGDLFPAGGRMEPRELRPPGLGPAGERRGRRGESSEEGPPVAGQPSRSARGQEPGQPVDVEAHVFPRGHDLAAGDHRNRSEGGAELVDRLVQAPACAVASAPGPEGGEEAIAGGPPLGDEEHQEGEAERLRREGGVFRVLDEDARGAEGVDLDAQRGAWSRVVSRLHEVA